MATTKKELRWVSGGSGSRVNTKQINVWDLSFETGGLRKLFGDDRIRARIRSRTAPDNDYEIYNIYNHKGSLGKVNVAYYLNELAERINSEMRFAWGAS